MQYNLVHNGRHESLALSVHGEWHTISSAHVNFQRLKTYLVGGGQDEQEVARLLDAYTFVRQDLMQLSERVAFTGTTITFDGAPINTALSQHIVRLLHEQQNAQPAVRFMEHLATNPSHLSRVHLWTWLSDRDFSLTYDGHIIGYKAVSGGRDNLSITAGHNEVTVNGAIHTGHVPNPIGAEISMNRVEVNPHRDDGCSHGLHVGTWDYALSFSRTGGQILTVSVNPRDVVAVPRDCAFQKMRVCRYQVLAVADTPHNTALVDPFSLLADDEEVENMPSVCW